MLSSGSVARQGPAVPTLIYDGECSFCRRWVRRFKKWERGDLVELLPLQDKRALSLSGRSRARLEAAMHLVRPDGGVFAGADAAEEIMVFVRGGWLLRLLFKVPGVRFVAHSVYGWVANRRHRLGCGGRHCRLPVASDAESG